MAQAAGTAWRPVFLSPEEIQQTKYFASPAVRQAVRRIDPTLRALFRAAGAELVATDTPPKVTINEYLDVAKAFYPEGKEAKFVNGVLDHMAHAARPQDFG